MYILKGSVVWDPVTLGKEIFNLNVFFLFFLSWINKGIDQMYLRVFFPPDYPQCTEKTCANGACYNNSQHCNGLQDCRDGSDEYNCSE